MQKTTVKPFSAKITFGLEIGYTKKSINRLDIIDAIQEYQNRLICDKNVVLSASISDCDIVLSGQVEPHLTIRFINYPKFLLEETVLKEEIEKMVKLLMRNFDQNRIVIEYLDETVMFENSDSIDPRINRII